MGEDCQGAHNRLLQPKPATLALPMSSTMPAMSNLTAVIDQLQQERTRLQSQLEALRQAISTLNGSSGSRRTMSTSARARIAAAQRARWAKAKGKVVSIATARKRRKMSAAAIARIRAAQKARWAKWRKAKKTG
jgi:hypothetical protein